MYDIQSLVVGVDGECFNYCEHNAVKISVFKRYQRDMYRQLKREKIEDEPSNEIVETTSRDYFRLNRFFWPPLN